MMETALSILQNFRQWQNLDQPTTLLSLTDPDKLQLLQFLYQTCKELRRKGPFRQQIFTHEFDTAANVNTYALPRDFYESLPLTYYNQDTDWRLIGPLTDEQFLAFKEGEAFMPTEYVWRIKGFDENPLSVEGRQLELYPTPSGVENLTFEYIHGHLFVPPNWAASTAYSSGDFVTVNGRIYQCDTNGTSGSTPPSGTDDNQTDGTTQWDHYDEPYDTIVADTDRCLFDADLVELGVRWKNYLEKESSLAAATGKEYKREIIKMRFRWEGQTRIRGDRLGIRAGRRHRPYVAPGSWSWA